jgi:hypothetical protein
MISRKVVTIICSVLFFLRPIASIAQEVWFAPPDDMDRGPRSFNKDFPHLFDPSPVWRAQVEVFALSPLFTASAPEQYVRRVTGFLAAHNIALAVGVGAVQMDNAEPIRGECGYGVEGMTRPNRNNIIFNRLKRCGLDVRYVAMDEPLTFGHYYSQAQACGYSIEEVARRVGGSVAEIRRFYPEVKFVDYEAPTIVASQRWLADLEVWLRAYRQATGSPPDSVVFDVDWAKPWQTVVAPGAAMVHRNGVRAGIFLDGKGDSDAEAIAAYKRNMQAVDEARIPLDLVVIANWTPHPTRNLPESDPNTLSGVLAYYLSRHGH